MKRDLKRALNDAVVRRLAGDQSYQRGYDYYLSGHVVSLKADRNEIQAVVRGAQDYTVFLASDDGILDYACDCPVGSDGAFCKHCVAAALGWMNGGAASVKAKRRAKAPRITLADAEKYLREDPEAAISLVIAWAKDDDRLRDRLLQYAARRAGPESEIAAARGALQKASRVRGFIHYREASSWARGVYQAIDSIAQLLEAGHGTGAMELCEFALGRLVVAAGSIDDSDGNLSILRDRLEEIHLRACQQARPDPEALAQRLFEWEMQDGLDVFFDAAERYAKVLGDEGLRRYRELASPRWEEVSPRTQKDGHWGMDSHFRIRRIMESLARVSGDVEQLVAVLSHDLLHAFGYLQIAQEYQGAGNHDKALEWAEKGLKAFPTHTDSRLREFAAEEYHRRGRHEEAMRLMWTGFLERPYLETYCKLERHARTSGGWPQWRERALAEIRLRIAKGKATSSARSALHWMEERRDHSVLVEIFLYECNAEAAWLEAAEGGCSESLWLQLASEREKEYPADAASIYLEQAGRALSSIRNGRYEEPVELLAKAAAAMKRLDRNEDFVRALQGMQQKYKAKRNFIKLVDRERKSLYLS